ncbi:glycosyltransferase [Moraxella oblonga]|uniref:glycosyltransferase n=1 Tax=Moraxella oblonga TaxID=200413 RepID=UPI000AC3758D|nr:glycosyltransferase [Moraxella oblonga]
MIIFLGRLESVKRGWLFCEIAKRLPQFNFYVLGQTFRESSKNAQIFDEYKNISNLHFVGHVDGEQKTQYLKDAKILVNTSIHEALPISFLEALSYGTLLVSNRNPEQLTEKFGVHVGDVLGDGFDKVDLYVHAIKYLMNDEIKMRNTAINAIKYIKNTHNVDDFIKNIRKILIEEIEKK